MWLSCDKYIIYFMKRPYKKFERNKLVNKLYSICVECEPDTLVSRKH